MTLSAIYRYPIKSLGGQSLTVAEPRERGLAGDRRWMFVDADGRFITQREHRQLATFRSELGGDGTLRIFEIDSGQLLVELPREVAEGGAAGAKPIQVTVWDDTFVATHIDHPELDRTAVRLAIAGARLVFLDPAAHRPLEAKHARHDEEVSFSDGYPYLFANTASLGELGRRLGEPLDMLRFRPNLVVDGAAPFAEDGWSEVRVGHHAFYTPKPCARCVMVTHEPETGHRNPAVLRELATFRKVGNKVLFGMNGVWSGGAGTLRVGDVVEVVGTPAGG